MHAANLPERPEEKDGDLSGMRAKICGDEQNPKRWIVKLYKWASFSGFFSAFIAEKDFVDNVRANWYTDSVKREHPQKGAEGK